MLSSISEPESEASMSEGNMAPEKKKTNKNENSYMSKKNQQSFAELSDGNKIHM